MKKYALAAALVLVSTSALADRTVSGQTNEWVGMNENKVSACQNAKREADRQAREGEQVESYSQCDCEQKSNGHWICSVDAKLERRN